MVRTEKNTQRMGRVQVYFGAALNLRAILVVLKQTSTCEKHRHHSALHIVSFTPTHLVAEGFFGLAHGRVLASLY